ncbi:MAG: M14 family metallopeptidase [Bacillota bacterium]|jgi:murein tripeptide amidase MpaA
MSSKVGIGFDEYLTYSHVTDYLKKTAEAYPDLTVLESAGKSYEGRDIWALTITNKKTGSASKKPALYVDGNIHAGEVTGCMVALYLIDYLVDNYGKDEEVTYLLDTRTFYILPRVNPDGAEVYLTTPTLLRSSVRVWPDEEAEDLPGLHRADVDGDGMILQMRVRDDNKGEWKVSEKDPRLMIPRRPGERKGAFYRIYPEGFIKDYEGEPVPIHRSQFGLDLNRNFPSNWDTKVPGGGDYAGSEPEARAIIDFITRHPNIGGIQALHTSGGFYYRNPCQYPEEKMDPEDLRATKEIAKEGTLISGYPDVKSPNKATLTEWAYEHKGLIAYTTELWNRYERAGIDLVEWQKTTDPAKREEQNLKLLDWNDRELAGKGFKDWTPFDHPQLGKVEIGGWDPKFCLQNPPPALLKQECHKNALWIVRHAAALPEVHLTALNVEDVDEEVKKVTAVVENFGYLPTCVTNKAKELGAAKEDVAEIYPGPGVTVLGKRRQSAGFLEGYISGTGRGGPAKSTARITWMVKVAPGTPAKLAVEYRSQRGGTARAEYPEE